MAKLTWRLAHLLYRFATKATTVQTRWRAALPELSSPRNWERLFDKSD